MLVGVVSRLQSRFLWCADYGCQSHSAISHSKGEIGEHKRSDTVASVVAASAEVGVEKEFCGILVQIPLHDGSCQIPSNVGWAREKVIVSMGSPVDFEQSAVLLQNPLVWLHAPID